MKCWVNISLSVFKFYELQKCVRTLRNSRRISNKVKRTNVDHDSQRKLTTVKVRQS